MSSPENPGDADHPGNLDPNSPELRVGSLCAYAAYVVRELGGQPSANPNLRGVVMPGPAPGIAYLEVTDDPRVNPQHRISWYYTGLQVVNAVIDSPGRTRGQLVAYYGHGGQVGYSPHGRVPHASEHMAVAGVAGVAASIFYYPGDITRQLIAGDRKQPNAADRMLRLSDAQLAQAQQQLSDNEELLRSGGVAVSGLPHYGSRAEAEAALWAPVSEVTALEQHVLGILQTAVAQSGRQVRSFELFHFQRLNELSLLRPDDPSA